MVESARGILAESPQLHARFLSRSQRTSIFHSNMGGSSCIHSLHSHSPDHQGHSHSHSHNPDRRGRSPDLHSSCHSNSSWCQELRIWERRKCLLLEYELLSFHRAFYTPSVVDVTKKQPIPPYQLICMKTMSLIPCSFIEKALTPINFRIPLWLLLNSLRYVICLL